MELGLENKVALIAGGSSGIGLATAIELAREGTHVAIGARDRDRLAVAERRIMLTVAERRIKEVAERGVKEVAERGVKEVAERGVHTTSIDITDHVAACRWVDAVAAEFGALHIVVVSGGSPPVGTATQFGFDDYRSAVERVFFPAVGIALAALPHLRAARWGRLLFVASETAHAPVAPLALSGMTRAAIVRFAQALAADVGRDGITVNVLAPGHTRTPPLERAAQKLANGGDAETQLNAMGHHSALGRLARPEEVAAVATFLASERASFVTGAVHLIDGGAGAVGPQLPHLTLAGSDTFFT